MGWDNNIDAWQLCGCSSEEEYNQQVNNYDSFYDMMMQIAESENP